MVSTASHVAVLPPWSLQIAGSCAPRPSLSMPVPSHYQLIAMNRSPISKCSSLMNVCSCGYSSLTKFETRITTVAIVVDDSKDCSKVVAGRKGDEGLVNHVGYQLRCPRGQSSSLKSIQFERRERSLRIAAMQDIHCLNDCLQLRRHVYRCLQYCSRVGVTKFHHSTTM